MSRSAFSVDGGIQLSGNDGELQYKDGDNLGASSLLIFENGILTVDQLNVSTSSTGITTGAGGSDTSIQFNNNGSFSGSTNITWDESAKQLDVVGDIAISGTSFLRAGTGSNDTNTIGIGGTAQALGACSIAIGSSAYANNSSGVAIGANSINVGFASTSMGRGSCTTAARSLALGYSTHVTNACGVALGANVEVTSSHGIGIGQLVVVTGTSAIAIGCGTDAIGTNAIAIGNKALACNSSISIGASAYVDSNESISIGNLAGCNGTGTTGGYNISIGRRVNRSALGVNIGTSSIAIGNSACSTNTGSISMGNSAKAKAIESIAIGVSAGNNGTGATGANSVSIGRRANFSSTDQAIGTSSIAIGNATCSTSNSSIAIGLVSLATATGAISIGRGISSGTESTSIGAYTNATAAGAISIGRGSSSTLPLINEQSDSIIFGWDQVEPQVRFASSAGQFINGTGDLIIGSGATITGATALAKVHIEGDLAIVDGTQQNGFVLTSDASGIASWQSGAGGSADGVVSGGTLNGSAILALSRTEGLGDVNIDLTALSGGSGGSPAGIDTEIQFNSGGTFGANNNFTFSASTNSLTIGSRAAGAEGVRSFTQGYNNIASGINSHAEGCVTTASGLHSHAEGTYSKAFAYASHAEGYYTQACGSYTHSEGIETRAIGTASHSEGSGTRACGTSSHAEGCGTIASGINSHAQGYFSIASGLSSHAGGCGIVGKEVLACGCASFNHSTNTASQTIGFGALANCSAILGGINHNIAVGNVGAAIIGGTSINLTGSSYVDTTAVNILALMTIPTSGSSDQVLVRNTSTGKVDYVSKSSLGGGGGGITTANNGLTVNGTNVRLGGSLTGDTCINTVANGFSIGLSTSTLGLTAFSTGRLTRADGDYSTASGKNNFACGNCSFATGYFTRATGTTAFASGRLTKAYGDYSFAAGNDSCAIGNASHAEGFNTHADADFSHAEGCGSIASGIMSHAEGCISIASGCMAHAEGCETIASGSTSHAEGQTTIAGGIRSHSQGQGTKAMGNYSHAEGLNTCACGTRSHSEGNATLASGYYSHAEGSNSKAYANASHAEGLTTHASGVRSHTEGQSTCTTSAAVAGHAEGVNTTAGNTGAHAEGHTTISCGIGSHTGGIGTSGGKEVYACGNGAFNHSGNATSQVAGHGALASNSAILGGCDHNIASSNLRAVIIGGNGIKLVSGFSDFTVVDKFAINSTPAAGGSEDVLTWNATSGKINKVTQVSISDENLKTIIKPIDNILEGIIDLNVYEYELNDKVEPINLIGERKYGLIAQEVEENFPLVVKDNIEFKGIKYKGVEYRELVPILVQAIKELNNKIEDLKSLIK